MSINKDTRKLDDLRITYLPVNAVKPNDYNPNRQGAHEFELLCKSIRTDGFTQPVVALAHQDGAIPTPENPCFIVDGFHRWKAAQAIGMEEVPVVLVPMSEAQRRIATLRHNRARGHEDPTKVAALLKELHDEGNLDWAKDELMLDPVEIRHLTQNVDTTVDSILTEQAKAEAAEVAERENLSHEEEMQLASDLKRQKGDALQRSESAVDSATNWQELEDIYTVRLVYADDQEVEILREALGERDDRQERLLEMCRMVNNGTL